MTQRDAHKKLSPQKPSKTLMMSSRDRDRGRNQPQIIEDQMLDIEIENI